MRNGVLLSAKGEIDATAAVTLSRTKGRMLALLGGDTESAGTDLAGGGTVLQTLLDVFQRGAPSFNTVTPQPTETAENGFRTTVRAGGLVVPALRARR
ncbi:alkyl sulfatase C-terminal domain-containing protein [Arthrobacter sp.]|uniref:alkyl sulfatase C-terminal domain-containing protein n=1 Tax=Arthrobacter sp. TaxID=1667 RepID=UPI0033966204